MTVLFHFVLAVFATAAIWYLSGILIEATDRVAHRYNQSRFFVAFFVLGLLTSISEFSVAVNATLEGVPQVSAGNLVGASFVIFLLIIPILAVAADGIEMHLAITKGSLLFLLFVVLLPAFFVLDGEANRMEGVAMLAMYASLVLTLRRKEHIEQVVEAAIEKVGEELMHTRRATLRDLGHIAIGAVLILLTGKILVDEAVYFSLLLTIPPSFIGLLLLSVGTNVPELAIGLRCALGKYQHVAFGDYLGSAAANTSLFGLLVLANGDFSLERSEFISTFLLLLPGLLLFYVFARSKSVLSRTEGTALFVLYVLFFVSQIFNITQIIPRVQGVMPT